MHAILKFAAATIAGAMVTPLTGQPDSTSAPPILHNPAVISHNSRLDAILEEDRAGAVYEAALAATPFATEKGRESNAEAAAARPGDPRWEEACRFAESHAEALVQIREASRRRFIGIKYCAPESPGADRRLNADGSWTPWLFEYPKPQLGQLRYIARLLAVDARCAAEADDAQRCESDLVALWGLAAQMHREPEINLIDALVAIAIVRVAADATLAILEAHPDLLTEAHLESLQRAAHSPRMQDTMKRAFAGERALHDDAIRMLYADQDRMTKQGFLELHKMNNPDDDDRVDAERLFDLYNDRFATRSAAMDFADRIYGLASDRANTPLWEWEGAVFSALFREVKDEQLVAAIFFPAADKAYRTDQLARQQHEGVLAVIALHQHRAAHGQWPASLDELVPHFLNRIPTDHHDGRALKYRLRDSEPIIYSIGADRDDDAGAAPEGTTWDDLANWRPLDADDLPDGDWVLFPPMTE